MTSHTPVAAWQRQLEQTMAPYVDLAIAQHARVQVVLSVDERGNIDRPKMTIIPPLDKANGEGV